MDTAARQAEELARAVAEHGPGSVVMADAYRRARDEVTLDRWTFTVENAQDLSRLTG